MFQHEHMLSCGRPMPSMGRNTDVQLHSAVICKCDNINANYHIYIHSNPTLYIAHHFVWQDRLAKSGMSGNNTNKNSCFKKRVVCCCRHET